MTDLLLVGLLLASFAALALLVRGWTAVSVLDVVGLVVAVLLAGYLVLTLLEPERF